MKILVVASEAVPFAKTGGLADVAGILPKFLYKKGHDVRVVIPLYGCIDRQHYQLRAIPGALGVWMGIIGEKWCEVYEATLPNSDVPIYFIAHDDYFNRPRLYNELSGEGFKDNDNRFVFLSRAAIQLCKKIGFQPDVIHCNDWHSAVIPVLLNTAYRNDPFFAKTASLLTIHNIKYQGNFYPGLMDVLDIGWNHFNHLELECYNQVNLLKGGIYHATLVNAVSDGYAREIQTLQFGYGLDGVVRDRSHALRSVINGMDYDEWNPATDPHIPAHYDIQDLSPKKICKRELQKEMGLELRDDIPLFGLVSRLVEQKGISLLASIFEKVMNFDLQIALLGSGAPWAHQFFSQMSQRYPGKFACYLGFSNPLAHRIEAASDFFLMPSTFEPCGLNQLYSLRYGAIPIVHDVGGLSDTVDNYDPSANKGTGFKYSDQTPNALYNTIGWALHTWYHAQNDIQALRMRGMQRRFSWDKSADDYLKIYQEACRLKLS